MNREGMPKANSEKKERVVSTAVLVLIAVFSLVWIIFTPMTKDYYYDNFSEYHTEDSVSSPILLLEAGEYNVKIIYSAVNDAELTVYTNPMVPVFVSVPSTNGEITEFSYPISLEQTYDMVRINSGDRLNTGLEIISMTVAKEDYMNYDRVLLIILAIVILVLMYIVLERKKGESNAVSILIITVAVIVSSIPVLLPHLISVHGQDLIFHLSRIEGMSNGIRERQLPVQVFPSSFSGFGMLGAIYPGLVMYFPAILRTVCKISLVTSWKLLVLFTNILTAICMYIAVKEVLACNYDVSSEEFAGSKMSSCIAAVASALYLLAPYRLNNMYIRAAYGEVLAMVFLPLVIAGLYAVFVNKESKKWYDLIIGMAGIVSSHALSMVLAVFICLVIGIIYIRTLTDKNVIKKIAVSAGITTLLSAWFILPFFHYINSERLNVSELNRDFSSFAISVSELFKNIPKYVTVLDDTRIETHYSIGAIGLLLMVSSLFIYYRYFRNSGSERLKYCRNLVIMSAIFALLSTKMIPWKMLQSIGFINALVMKLQFPWRLLSVATALLILGATILISDFIINKPKGTEILKCHNINTVLLMTVLLAVLYSALPMLVAYMGQNTIIRVSDGQITEGGAEEYLPEIPDGVLKFYTAQTYAVCSDYDSIYAENYSKNGTKVSFSYSSSKPQQYVDVPLTYYSDYYAYEIDENGNERVLDTSMSEYGTLRVHLTEHDMILPLAVVYRINPIVYIGMIISVAGLILLAYLAIKKIN